MKVYGCWIHDWEADELVALYGDRDDAAAHALAFNTAPEMVALRKSDPVGYGRSRLAVGEHEVLDRFLGLAL